MLAVAVLAVAPGAFLFDLLFLDFFGGFIILPLALLPFALVGALLMWRVPRNPVGWLIATSGVLFALVFITGAYSYRAVVQMPGSLPGGELVVWLSGLAFPAAGGSTMLALFRFPSGRALGRAWRLAELGVAVIIVAGTVGLAFKTAPLSLPSPLTNADPSPPTIPNPLAAAGVVGAIADGLSHLLDSATMPIILLGPASLVARFRRSSAVERQQIKWLAYSAALAFGLLVASALTPPPPALGNLANYLWGIAVTTMGLIPISIGIAILRYRLYDINLLINRTLVYGALTALLAAAYAGGIVLFQALLRPLTSGSEIAVTASTLAVTLLFGPLRRRIQKGVDRRFYRRRYDAAATVDAFALRLRDSVDLDALTSELLSVVGDTVQPAHASVWLRERAR